MLCINCGKQVNDTDSLCPYCGAKLNNSGDILSQQAEQIPTSVDSVQSNSLGVESFQNSSPVEKQQTVPFIASNPTAQANPVNQTSTGQPPKKEKNNTLIIIAILVVVMIVVALILGKSLLGKSPTKNEQKVDEVPEKEGKKESFKGYKFTIPEGYKTSRILGGLGLVISNDSRVFTINIDQTNSYEVYFSSLKQQQPDIADKAEITIKNKKYLIVDLSTEEIISSQYITPADNGETFIGLAYNKNNPVDKDDYLILNKILESREEYNSNHSDGIIRDAGINGPLFITSNELYVLKHY